MSEKFRRSFMKEKEARAFLNYASEKLQVDLEQTFKTKTTTELVETETERIFLINGRPLLAQVGERVFPTLVFSELLVSMPKVVVDMGAVPYVCKGANVMAPGIRRFEGDFGKCAYVVVMDEKHGKPLAIGEALIDVEEARRTKQGAVVKNVHFVGDETWNLVKRLSPIQ